MADSSVRIAQTSFSGGIMSPDMYGRHDDPKFLAGLKECRNFICLPTGPVENRPGFEMVREVKDSSKAVRLLPFIFASNQTVVLEFGHRYIRFHTNGMTVMSGNSPYEISTPYDAEDLFDIRYTQKEDVITLVHPRYAPRELKRFGAISWRLDSVTFNSSLPAPGGVTAVKATTAQDEVNPNAYTFDYKVTALDKNHEQESDASSKASVVANIYNNGTTVRVSWNAVSGATYYRIYRSVGGVYSYIGETDNLSMIDDNIEPDSSVTPPRHDDVFSSDRGISSVTVTNQGSGYGSNGYIDSVKKSGLSVHYEIIDPYSGRKTGEENYTNVAVPSQQFQYLYPDDGYPLFGQSGTGYDSTATYTDVVSVQGGSGGKIKITWSRKAMSYTQIHDVELVSSGSGYSSGQTAQIVVSGDYFINYGGQRWGKNKTTTTIPLEIKGIAPNVYVTDPTGTGAVLEAEISGGKIIAIHVRNPGRNYTNPTIVIDPGAGGGSGAAATASVASTGDYPATCTYFEQRRVFGGTGSWPQKMFMTKTGTDYDFSYSVPVKDDDRIKFEFASNERNSIAHLVPLSRLLVLTESAEWVITAMNSDAITPTSVGAKAQSYVGCSDVRPVIVNNCCVFASRRGGHMRVLAYNYNANGFTTADLSLRAAEMFDRKTIKDLSLAKAPVPIVWAVNSEGELLGLTYIPEQEIAAWHRHTTDGKFESCTTVYEGNDDVLYCVVRRFINGQYKRFVERMVPREFATQADAFFVDCGATYDGSPTSVITGLGYLEGKEVAILADGAVEPRQVVTNGQITLTSEYSKVHVGLPIDAYVETLPATLPMRDNSGGMGQEKNVNAVILRLKDSSGVFVGASTGELVEYKQRKGESLGTPPEYINGDIRVLVRPGWDRSGSIQVRQNSPLPITLISFAANISYSGF